MSFSALSKRMLKAHANVGLLVSAILYLICLTGSLAVFAPIFERYEQTEITEYQTLSPVEIANAVSQYQTKHNEDPLSLYVILPNDELPRAHISDGENEYWLDQQGQILAPVKGPWGAMLKELHTHLLLPETLGTVIVGIFGVMLASLIITGLFSHQRIIKDLFRWRRGGNKTQATIDLHNRLSVWGLPFHIMMAITGAFFGLATILMAVAIPAYFNGDQQALLETVYGKEPKVEQVVNQLNLEQAFSNFQRLESNHQPIYLVIQNLNKPNQAIEIAAQAPERLIYSEIYHFDAEGNFLATQGFDQGPIGQQVIYSVYRLHFGQFGNILVRWLYLFLGLALTMVVVTGVNIWLTKRPYKDKINASWSAIVWGTPAAFITSACASILLNLPAFTTLVVSLMVAFIASYKINHHATTAKLLNGYSAIMLALLAISHQLIISNSEHQLSLIVNACLALTSLLLAYKAQSYHKDKHLEVSEAC